MSEVLPIKVLTDSDGIIFGSFNVSLGKLVRLGIPVAEGIVVSAPDFQLKTILELYDFGSSEVFEQSLNLVKKELESLPVPEVLRKETKGHDQFLVSNQIIKSTGQLWKFLLLIWVDQIKQRLWQSGFTFGLTEDLEPQVVTFVKKVTDFGSAFYDKSNDEILINIEKGQLEPKELKKLDEIVRLADKKLLINRGYSWILDGEVKLSKVLAYPNRVLDNQNLVIQKNDVLLGQTTKVQDKTTVKMFLDLSAGLVIENNIDGVYISGERIFNLNDPNNSYEELIFKLIESANTLPNLPVFLKLVDVSDGMGRIRGAFRLIHQKSLLEPMCEALNFTRNKKGYKNVHVVIPFVRGVSELMQIKRELAVKKLIRKNNLEIWLELCVPENLVNLEEYLVTGIDGVVLNLDELISHLIGFDHKEEQLSFYKNDMVGLLKFLEAGFKILHQSRIPFIAFGNLSLDQKVLEFLVEHGVYGVVVERYELDSVASLLHQAERKMVLRRAFQSE